MIVTPVDEAMPELEPLLPLPELEPLLPLPELEPLLPPLLPEELELLPPLPPELELLLPPLPPELELLPPLLLFPVPDTGELPAPPHPSATAAVTVAQYAIFIRGCLVASEAARVKGRSIPEGNVHPGWG
jgi:hypothetical protein